MDIRKKSTETRSCLTVSVFATPLSWMGLLGRNQELVSVCVGHSSSKTIFAAARKIEPDFEEIDWNPQLRSQLEAYAEGEPVDFRSCKLQFPPMTAFRLKIIEATRKLAFGQTTSYGDLARLVGHPRAARAVGTVMSTNHFPILIPCHRVLAAGGKLGGYTSPLGTKFKQRLLEMESRHA